MAVEINIVLMGGTRGKLRSYFLYENLKDRYETYSPVNLLTWNKLQIFIVLFFESHAQMQHHWKVVPFIFAFD